MTLDELEKLNKRLPEQLPLNLGRHREERKGPGVSTIALFFGDKYRHIIPVLNPETGHITRCRLSADGHLGAVE